MKKNCIYPNKLFSWKILKLMRNTLIIILITVCQAYAGDSYSQNARLTLNLNEVTVASVLEEIQNNSEFYFLFNSKLIDVKREVSISVEDKKISEILTSLFSGTGVNYVVYDRQIILTPSDVTELSAAMQQRRITGTVTDASDGQPIVGANVLIEGTTIGVITDAYGKYTLDIPKDEGVLIVSFLGYVKESIVLSGQSVIDVVLVPDIVQLDEVVVVGYGTMKKSDVVTSVTSVKADKMTEVATNNVGEMLRGRVAGLQVTTADNGPGGTSILQIRGKGSVKAKTTPLIIADGIEIGSINDVNPDDIASVEVLKDAASQAIYGARASNGVVLITTKRGKAGKINVDYNGFYGWQKVTRFFDVYSPEEYTEMKKQANIAASLDPMANFTATELESIANEEYIDWADQITRTAPMSNHNLSVSGGNDKTTAFLGMNYQNTDGVVKNTNYQKGSVRLNIDQKVNEWFKIGTNFSYQVGRNTGNNIPQSLLESVRTSPLGKIYNDDGSWRVSPTSTTAQENRNPIPDIYNVDNISTSQNDIETIYMDFAPIKGLTYRILGSRRSWNLNESSFSGTESIYGLTNKGMTTGRYTRNQEINFQLDNIITYNTSINKHNIGATFVHSVTQRDNQKFEVSPSQMPDGFIGIYNMGSAIQHMDALTGSQRRLVSFMGRVQYDYASKYYINVTARADGSSVFGENNKWGYFPSMAVAWNISNEEFLKGFAPLSMLKLRFSYGSVGNEGIDPYQSLALAKNASYLSSTSDDMIIGYVPGSAKPNPDLKWEESTTANLAFDFGFFESRLNGTIELYNTITKDLLIDRTLNSATGYTTQKQNVGEIQNKGIEIQLDGAIIRKRDFTINAGMTFSKNHNEVLHLYGDLNNDGIEDDDRTNGWFIGQPIDVTWRWQADGILQVDEEISPEMLSYYGSTGGVANIKPGWIKIKDQNGDGLINDLDNVFTNRAPKWMGSLYFNAAYKGIDFTLEMNTVQGVQKINQFLSEYTWGGDLRGVFNGVKVDYWTPDNPTGNFPRPDATNTPKNLALLNMQDASYFRIGTISLGYTLPKTVLSSLRLTKVRLYVTAHNPYTKTKFEAFSPERTADENSGNQPYPESQNLVGGIQVSF